MISYPEWIKVNPYNKKEYLKTKSLIEKNNLNTVCVEANCPNRYECFSNRIATFMILGDTCTRNCRYCNIKKGVPEQVNKNEPIWIAEAVKKLALNYVVITCVTRDDLPDGGAEHFTNTIKEIRKINPKCKIELLISDLGGNWDSLKKIVDSKPDVLNHNIEVVRKIFPVLRPQGNYDLSIELLKKVKEFNSKIKIKSGFMLGLGEKEKEIIQTINDLKEMGCDIITIGQYLAPSSEHYKVKKFYSPGEFSNLKKKAENLGIKYVVSGPLVRSSYHALEAFENAGMEIN